MYIKNILYVSHGKQELNGQASEYWFKFYFYFILSLCVYTRTLISEKHSLRSSTLNDFIAKTVSIYFSDYSYLNV